MKLEVGTLLMIFFKFQVYVHFCVAAMAFTEEANVTVWTVGKARNAKYGLRNVSLRIVPGTVVVEKVFAFVMPGGTENTVRNVSNTS